MEDIQDLQERKRKIRERTEKFFPNIKVESDMNSTYTMMQNFSILEKILISLKTIRRLDTMHGTYSEWIICLIKE